ncbi:Box C/D snoRNA protein 1 [Trichinella sp. T8]|nr:Box C/D snoRNA protein 1 [Trichinella sp. T8]
MFSNCESSDDEDLISNLEELLNQKKKNNKPTFDNKHCDVCKKNARYCCPACQARSCSLECVKKHKQLINCDGLACRTRFVPMQNYSTVNFMQDYNMLMEAAGKYDHFRETLASYFKKHNAHQDRNFQYNCRSNGILLVRLPHYCYKNMRNKSFYNKRADTSFWSVEFIFHFNNNNNPLSVICDKIPNSLSLLTLLKNLFKPKPNSEFAEQSTLLNNYANIINLNDLCCFFKVEQNWWTKDDRYYAVDMNSSLNEILKDKIVVEFPTFHICQSENAYKFPIFDQAMKLAYLRSKVLLRKSDCADLSVGQILQMMRDDERIGESDLKIRNQQSSDDEVEDGELVEREKVQNGRIKRFYPVDQGESGVAGPKKRKLLKSSERRQKKQQMIANLAKRIVEQQNIVDKNENSSTVGFHSNDETVICDNYENVDYRSEGELSSSSTSSEANAEAESQPFVDYFNLGLETNITNFSDHEMPLISVILLLKPIKMPDSGENLTNYEEVILKMCEAVDQQQSDTEVSASDAEMILEAEPGFMGLYNLSKNCYMNCIIQVLCNTVEIKDFILQNKFRNQLKSYDALFEYFVELIQSMWNGRLLRTTLVKFVKQVHECMPAFVKDEEEDSSEFFNLLMYRFHENLKDANGRSIISDTFSGTVKSDICCDGCQAISSIDERFFQLNISFRYVIVTFWGADLSKKDLIFPVDCECRTVSDMHARFASMFDEREENLMTLLDGQIVPLDYSVNSLMNYPLQISVCTQTDSIEYYVTLITSCVVRDEARFRCFTCSGRLPRECTICSSCLNAYFCSPECTNSLSVHLETCIAAKRNVSVFPRLRNESFRNFMIRLLEESRKYVNSSNELRQILSTPHNDNDSLNVYELSKKNCENSKTLTVTWISTHSCTVVDDVQLIEQLDGSIRVVDLTELLNYYISDEQLHFLRECSSCNRLGAAKKSLKLKSLPKVLVFTMKRVVVLRNIVKYLDLPISYPLRDLDMSPYLCADASAASSTKYQLYGVVSNIKQTKTSNHFFASVTLPATENEPGIDWRLCDDLYVRTLAEENRPGSFDTDAYMLFYRLQDDEQEKNNSVSQVANHPANQHGEQDDHPKIPAAEELLFETLAKDVVDVVELLPTARKFCLIVEECMNRGGRKTVPPPVDDNNSGE